MAERKRRGGWIPSVRAGALRGLFVSSVLAFSQASWPEGPSVSPEASVSAPATPRISASELERLSAISTRLAELNERLRTELETSRRNSSGLEASLADSTRELERFRQILSELELRATNSERESIALSEALRKADASLRSLEASFADYRKAAEARSRGLALFTLGAGLAALAGWTVALIVIIIR